MSRLWVVAVINYRLQATQGFCEFSYYLCKATSLSARLCFTNLLPAFSADFHFSPISWLCISSFFPPCTVSLLRPLERCTLTVITLWSPGCHLCRIEGREIWILTLVIAACLLSAQGKVVGEHRHGALCSQSVSIWRPILLPMLMEKLPK